MPRALRSLQFSPFLTSSLAGAQSLRPAAAGSVLDTLASHYHALEVGFPSPRAQALALALV